jgi:uncharacterized phage protein gp47/JayE
LKPTFNPNDPLSDFNIRGQAVTGLLSGAYADQEAVDNDTFLLTARAAAIVQRGLDYGMTPNPATEADTTGATGTGIAGSPIAAGVQAVYLPTGNIYEVSSSTTVAEDGTFSISLNSTTTGQALNIAAPDTLQFVSPPTGVNPTITLVNNMADGTNPETTASFATRVLNRLQQPPAGGNANDYQNWAFAADPSVRGAFIVRFGRGLGTVDIYITSGTTDIDTAVTNGESVVRLPSDGLLATVQAYYNAAEPLCDCAKVWSPNQTNVNVNAFADLASGLTMTTVPADPVNNPLNLTVEQLIQREVGRVLYKYPIGGRVLPGVGTSGYIVAQDIWEGLEYWLSAIPDLYGNVGIIPILTDWRIGPLNGSATDLPIAGHTLAAPGTITATQGV